jgi:hypothetical protein
VSAGAHRAHERKPIPSDAKRFARGVLRHAKIDAHGAPRNPAIAQRISLKGAHKELARVV